ncbi:MAG: hypothetical protein KF863_21375 [Rubrivivax sp.]|nr:hypothetical protein [Rubrivivax sp.]
MAMRNIYEIEAKNTGTGKYVDPLGSYIHKKDPLGLFKSRGGGGGTPVGDAYAALTREAWERYVTTWVPYQNDLIDYATDPNVVGDAMSRASNLVDESFEQQQGATQRRLAGLGLTLDEDEQRAADRSFGLARSLADVGAQNAARDQTLARRQSVLGNPAPTIPNI